MSGDGEDAAYFTVPADNFVTGQMGQGIVIDEQDEYVQFRMEATTPYTNASFEMGTLELLFNPTFMSLDGKEHRLVALGGTSGAGILLRKGAQNQGNAFQILVYMGGNQVGLTEIASDDFWFFSGSWELIRVTWDFTVGVGVQNVHVYANGSELIYSGTSTGPVSMPTATTERMTLGAWTTADKPVADGIIDDFKVWAEVLPP